MRSGSTGFSLEANSDVNGYGTRRMRRSAMPTTTWRMIEMTTGPESRRRPYFKNLIDSGELNRRNVPDWLRLSAADLAGEVVTMPRREDGEPEINEQLIVEYYSR